MKTGRIFISDCEGPISKNDNAFEITKAFIPRGDHFFSLVSKYDDVLADVVKKPGYRAGNTLKLITPFLKAYGVTNEKIVEYSSKNILLLPGAREMLHHLSSMLPSFIVSTSYEQYISSLCALIGFPFENVYCTRLDLDRYEIPLEEVERLREVKDEIAAFPMITIPDNAKSLEDLSERDRAIVRRLDEVFWREIPGMRCERMLEDINPVGGEEKARAVMEIVSKLESALAGVVYVGDSITDVQAFQLVKEGGGLTVSFNGNDYAVKNAEIAVLSDNAIVTSILVEAFSRLGKSYVLELMRKWSRKTLEESSVSKSLITSMLDYYPKLLPRGEVVDEDNVEELMRESSVFRKKVRGEAIGRLG